MSLHLNGQEIKGNDLKLGVNLPLAGEDMSGQSSYAAFAETGDKPKELTITLLIKNANAKDLTALVVLAEAKDSKGERTTYNIINQTAQAMNIRQVRFMGDLSVTEDESVQLWRVSFKLVENKSVPEVKEARQTAQPVEDLPADGKAVTDSVSPSVTDLERFESLLEWLDERVK